MSSSKAEKVVDTGGMTTVGTEGAAIAEEALLTVPLEVLRIRARTGTVRGTSSRTGVTVCGTSSRTAVTATTVTPRQIQEPDGR